MINPPNINSTFDVCVSAPYVYVIEKGFGISQVSKYRESRKGLEMIRKGESLPFSSLGFGPGRRGTLLMVARDLKGRISIIRLSGNKINKVCDFPKESFVGNPEFALLDYGDALELESYRGGEEPLLRNWLHRRDWRLLAPRQAQLFRSPVNSDISMVVSREFSSLKAAYTFVIKSYFRGTLRHSSERTLVLTQIPGESQQIDTLSPIPNCSSGSMVFAAFSSTRSYMVKIKNDRVRVWSETRDREINEESHWAGPIIVDSDEGFWQVSKEGLLVRLVLKRIKKFQVSGRSSEKVDPQSRFKPATENATSST